MFLDDFRIFCGDLGNEVTDEVLARAFSKYGTFNKAKVVRDKRTNKTRGYGFVSFRDPNDFVRAMREMNGELGYDSQGHPEIKRLFPVHRPAWFKKFNKNIFSTI